MTREGGACPESPRRSEGDSIVVPAQAEGNPDNTIVVPAKSLPRTRYGAGTQGRGVSRPSEVGAHAEPNSPVVPAPTTVVPAEAGTQGSGGGLSTAANPAGIPSLPKGPTHTERVLSAPEGCRRSPLKSHAKSSYPIRRREPIPVTLPSPSRPCRRTLGQSWTAPNPTHPNTTPQGRSRQGRHSQKGPGVRAHRGGKGRKTRTRGAHPRRAQNQGKTRTALARAGPLWRAHRLHAPRPLTTLVTATRLHNLYHFVLSAP